MAASPETTMAGPAPAPTGQRRRGYQLRMAGREMLRQIGLRLRALDGNRLKPQCFVIGAQKAGTTTLFGHLSRHPQVIPPIVKEVHYFDVAAHRPRSWYAANFPSMKEADARRAAIGRMPLTFDTTPYYIFHPDVAAQVRDFAPDARIIALLRDPVERAWSQYWHEWARGFEKLGPIEAFDAEAARVARPHESVGETETERFAHQHYTYVARSEYDRQIERWQSLFPAEQLLVLNSDRLFTDPNATLRRVTDFLGIDPFGLVKARTLNSGEYDPPTPEVKQWLTQRLAPSAERLRALLGDEFQWG